MFPGNRAAQFNASRHDFPARFFDTLQLIRITGIKKYQRMQVAVAGMKHIAMLKIIFLNNGCNSRQRFGQFCARHGTIVDQIIGGDTGNRAKRSAAAFPQSVSFGIIFGFTNIATLIIPAKRTDLGHLIRKADR